LFGTTLQTSGESPMTVYYELCNIAKEAKKDWGTEAQIEAENEFFDLVEKTIPNEWFDYLETYNLKANTDEQINEALTIVRLYLHLNGD
jgi:predicted glycosyltransferase